MPRMTGATAIRDDRSHAARAGDGASRDQQLRRRAHTRLDELLDQARREGLWGTVAVEVELQGGEPQVVRRRVTGSDK
jgi:hypothetical protein